MNRHAGGWGRTEGPERDLFPALLKPTLRRSSRQRAADWTCLVPSPGGICGWLAGDALDLLGGPLEDVADLPEVLGLVDRIGGEAIGGAAYVAEGEVDLVHRLVEEMA